MIQLSVVVCKKIQRRLTCYSSIINRSHDILLNGDFISWPARGRIGICQEHSPRPPGTCRPAMGGLVRANSWLGSEGNSAGPGFPSVLSIRVFRKPTSSVSLSDRG